MSNYELAQLNIAIPIAPIESPELADFVANLDRVNAIAEQSPGFKWRLQTEEGDATALRPFGDDIIVNMSVWQDLRSLNDFVFSAAHVAIMKRRREWFERMAEAYVVFWWVPRGHRPTTDEAKERLDLLRTQGSTEKAFTYRKPFPPPDELASDSTKSFVDECPAT